MTRNAHIMGPKCAQIHRFANLSVWSGPIPRDSHHWDRSGHILYPKSLNAKHCNPKKHNFQSNRIPVPCFGIYAQL